MYNVPQSSFLPAEFKLLVQIVSGSHELFHGTILVSFPKDYRARVCVCVWMNTSSCWCVFSQVSVEVEADVCDVRAVQSQNMVLKCLS